jgi:hypothetical protein
MLHAEPSAADMIEQARERAREIEEMKKVMQGPDRNMRLATFDVMVNSGDDAMRQVAIEEGLASTDSLLQGLAFKAAVLSLDRLILKLKIDETQSEAVQTAANKYIERFGDTYVLDMHDKDLKAGTFGKRNNNAGEISGTMLTFRYGNNTGTLKLRDEATVEGEVTLYHGGYGKFDAAAEIR